MVRDSGPYEEPPPLDAVAPACSTQILAGVVENVAIACRTYRLRLDAPAIARAIKPGQFVMVRPSTTLDPLLGRPFALYEVVRSAGGEPDAIDVVYLVLGRGTAALSERKPGDLLSVWGPLGQPFGPPPQGDAIFVAGGIGQTPFLSLGKWWLGQAAYGEQSFDRPAASARMLYGVRTAELAAGLPDFEAAGIPVEQATDDGSAGRRGFVTDLLRERLERGQRPAKVVGCGPPPMLRALSQLVDEFSIPCDLSLENHMACGFGACFSCVAPIRQPDDSVDLRRVCVEGPTFPAGDVVW
ncbi:MAG TPA: dihydroorotate dehydrogenase electron transfer subunit [Isosphaeraceae bacterium]|nr:dihydroorotate dehydrogenase electron transfer subunit [Isosphaeraceae bacterium]